MAQTVICRIMPYDSQASKNHGGAVTVLQIYSHSGGEPRRLVISRSQDMQLSYGDRIKSVSGTAGVLINPGTQAGIFLLSPTLPSGDKGKYRTELVIDDETTKLIARGKIESTNDIGTKLTSAGSFTR